MYVKEKPAVHSVIEVQRVSKSYGKIKRQDTSVETQALSKVSFSVAEGEFVGIMGPSGSGKSTLLNCLATIDAPTSGKVMLDGRDIHALRGKELADFRGRELGFVFQNSNLLDTLTAYENIALALTIQKVPAKQIHALVIQKSQTLGVEDVLQKYPYQLSGGQKQRIAAARATVANPRLLLADEPTGALDSKASRQMLESLGRLNVQNTTIVMVTHDAWCASFCSRIIFLKDGALFGELPRWEKSRERFHQEILRVVASMDDSDCPVSNAFEGGC